MKSLDVEIGYVSVPEYVGGDSARNREYTQGTYRLLESVASFAGCGWILDLRQNSGGNMWPMLAGLKPFLGSVPLGSASGPGGSGSPSWIAGTFVNANPPASPAPARVGDGGGAHRSGDGELRRQWPSPLLTYFSNLSHSPAWTRLR